MDLEKQTNPSREQFCFCLLRLPSKTPISQAFKQQQLFLKIKVLTCSDPDEGSWRMWMATLPTGPYATEENGDRAVVFPCLGRVQPHHGVDSFQPKAPLPNACLEVRDSVSIREHRHLTQDETYTAHVINPQVLNPCASHVLHKSPLPSTRSCRLHSVAVLTYFLSQF